MCDRNVFKLSVGFYKEAMKRRHGRNVICLFYVLSGLSLQPFQLGVSQKVIRAENILGIVQQRNNKFME